MHRRAALGLASAAAATFVARPVNACSLAVESPEIFGARPGKLGGLFRQWFARDELAFLGALLGPDPSVGVTPSDDFVRRAIALNPDAETKQIYRTVFTDVASFKHILAITAVGDRAFVAVSEQGVGGIGPDCSNLPVLRLFLVAYRAGRPASLALIDSGEWTGHGQIAHWNG